MFVHKGLGFSGNHILTNGAGLKGVEAGQKAGGFGGVKLGEPLEAAVQVGKGGGGSDGGIKAQVVKLGLEAVIGGAVEVQVPVDGDAGDDLGAVGGLGPCFGGVGAEPFGAEDRGHHGQEGGDPARKMA